MSVMLFDQESIDRLLGMVRFHHEKIAKILRYSPHYSHYVMRFPAVQDMLEEYIARIFWYSIVSNRVSYMLQYCENISLFDIKFEYVDVKRVSCTVKQLLDALGRLSYNMITNDGNGFMEAKWHEPFQLIKNCLAQDLASK